MKTEWQKPEKNNTYYNSEKNNGYFIQSEPNSILFHIKKWDGRSTLSVQEKSGVLFLVLAEDFVFLIILVCNITFCGSDYLLRMQWQTTDILMWLLKLNWLYHYYNVNKRINNIYRLSDLVIVILIWKKPIHPPPSSSMFWHYCLMSYSRLMPSMGVNESLKINSVIRVTVSK